MVYLKKYHRLVTWSAAVVVLAGLAVNQDALANPTIMKKAGQNSCSTCHDSRNGAVPSIDTLNPTGQRFLSCRFEQTCYDSVTASLPPPAPATLQPPPYGQYQPPPTGYQPVPGQYQPPPGQYQPPPTGYQPAPGQYQPPPAGYQPPPGQYQPPPAGYQPPPVAYQPQYQPQPMVGAEFPLGVYRNSCRELSLSTNKDNLFAICLTPSGASLHTALRNFRNCQSEIYVDAGYLRCTMRSGGLNPALRWVNVYNDQSLLSIDSVKFKQPGGNWTERLNGTISPREHRTIFLDAVLPCNMQIRLGALWDKLKDNMDTCQFAKIRDRDRDYVIE